MTNFEKQTIKDSFSLIKLVLILLISLFLALFIACATICGPLLGHGVNFYSFDFPVIKTNFNFYSIHLENLIFLIKANSTFFMAFFSLASLVLFYILFHLLQKDDLSDKELLIAAIFFLLLLLPSLFFLNEVYFSYSTRFLAFYFVDQYYRLLTVLFAFIAIPFVLSFCSAYIFFRKVNNFVKGITFIASFLILICCCYPLYETINQIKVEYGYNKELSSIDNLKLNQNYESQFYTLLQPSGRVIKLPKVTEFQGVPLTEYNWMVLEKYSKENTKSYLNFAINDFATKYFYNNFNIQGIRKFLLSKYLSNPNSFNASLFFNYTNNSSISNSLIQDLELAYHLQTNKISKLAYANLILFFVKAGNINKAKEYLPLFEDLPTIDNTKNKYYDQVKLIANGYVEPAIFNGKFYYGKTPIKNANIMVIPQKDVRELINNTKREARYGCALVLQKVIAQTTTDENGYFEFKLWNEIPEPIAIMIDYSVTKEKTSFNMIKPMLYYKTGSKNKLGKINLK
ncbi:MAG: hypothetical protein AB1782_10960 [Cyanobacteriota bacterium]